MATALSPAPITKPDAVRRGAVLGDYDSACRDFSWAAARAELSGLPGGNGLNIAHEAVDRHAGGARADAVALRWLDRHDGVRDVTYRELAEQSSRFANLLAKLGVKPGERVFTLLGRVPELYVAVLGTLKARAVLPPLFAAFGPEPCGSGCASAKASPVVSTYRDHGHALARGVPMEALLAEMFGRTTGCSRGRGGPMHLFDVGRRFYGGNAIVAGGIPVAVGLALADVLARRPRVTACLFGDSAAAEGEFHESLNLAALWRLPVVFCCENNQYAMGTALARSHAQTDLALRAAPYGLRSWSVDGMDAAAVREATRRAVDTARSGSGPCFLELRTYRFRAHSMYDAVRYRDKDEVARWRERDPVTLLADALRADGVLDEPALAALDADVATEIDEAVAAAREGPLEPVADLTRFVTSEAS